MSQYATDTEGIPKTDFDLMGELGCGLVCDSVENDEVKSRALTNNGTEAGEFLFTECAALESVMKTADFNAFSQDDGVLSAIESAIRTLTFVYQARLQVRNALRNYPMSLRTHLTDGDEITFKSLNSYQQFDALVVDEDAATSLMHSLVQIAKQKDAEYGASWCKRGGIGAWFTTVRKFDRIQTQLKNLKFDLWNVAGAVDETESLEETLKDGINYLLLILEKRHAIEKAVPAYRG